MANIDIEVAGRRYTVGCRDGEEEHLRSVAAMVDQRARDAAQALGNLSESRNLLFAALLLGDALKEARAGVPPPPPAGPDPALVAALEQLAARIEGLADRLEERSPTP